MQDRDTVLLYTTFYRISKANREILDSVILASNDVRLLIETKEKGGNSGWWTSLYDRLVKGKDGFFLCNPETDTVFLYTRDKSLTPVFHKIPSVRNQNPKVVIPNILDVSKYQFFDVSTLSVEDAKNLKRFHFRDKETGEIFRQNVILPEYKDKEFIISASSTKRRAYGGENGYVYEFDLIELKQAYKENKLSGKLKELVATLNEMEDNNVFMLVHFK